MTEGLLTKDQADITFILKKNVVEKKNILELSYILINDEERAAFSKNFYLPTADDVGQIVCVEKYEEKSYICPIKEYTEFRTQIFDQFRKKYYKGVETIWCDDINNLDINVSKVDDNLKLPILENEEELQSMHVLKMPDKVYTTEKVGELEEFSRL